jgi:hypothetical protein
MSWRIWADLSTWRIWADCIGSADSSDLLCSRPRSRGDVHVHARPQGSQNMFNVKRAEDLAGMEHEKIDALVRSVENIRHKTTTTRKRDEIRTKPTQQTHKKSDTKRSRPQQTDNTRSITHPPSLGGLRSLEHCR